MSDAKTVLETLAAHDVRAVGFRFTDLTGRCRQIGYAAGAVDERLLTGGVLIDGSSIAGWRDVNESDMLLKPALETAVLDPFSAQPSLIVLCDVLEPVIGHGYERDPRSTALRAEQYLAASGVADLALMAAELEFFVFDDARFDVGESGAFFAIDGEEAAHNSGTRYQAGNGGHRPAAGGGAMRVPPVDALSDLRAEIAGTLASLGVGDVHHHHAAAPAQGEIALPPAPLVRAADRVQLAKYAVHSVAAAYGKSATFMPKPVPGEAGSGMHVHLSLWHGKRPKFAGTDYADLSEHCLHFLGGVLEHARALNAFTNPTTNSYRRLAQGAAVPRLLAYSARNRSAAVRIPHAADASGKRVECRFPDACANPYLAFAAILLAGLDGVQRRVDPGEAMDRNLYDLPAEEHGDLTTVCGSLGEALTALDADRGFLTQAEVFSDGLIDAYIAIKAAEARAVAATPHPLEFKLYYSS